MGGGKRNSFTRSSCIRLADVWPTRSRRGLGIVTSTPGPWEQVIGQWGRKTTSSVRVLWVGLPRLIGSGSGSTA